MQCKARRFNALDRFIPYRSKRSIETATYFINEEVEELNVDKDRTSNRNNVNIVLSKWKKQRYQTLLKEMMGLSYNKILNIPRTFDFNVKKGVEERYTTWPVHPRRKPLIENPAVILSMPDLDPNFCHHVTDWGSTECVAFIYEAEVYIWQPTTRKECLVTHTEKRARNCVRWSKLSTKLAVGLTDASFAVIDCVKNVLSHESSCLCNMQCNVTSLEWSSDDYLITGCSNGRLCKWNPSLRLLNCQYPAHHGKIITTVLSSNERYLATTGTDTKVRIWFWPTMSDNFEIKCLSNIRGIAWHPWKGSMFAIGGSVGDGSITVWNASSHQQLAEKLESNNRFVDDLTWNRVTGELVVSYWHADDPVAPYVKGKSSIVVFANLNTEVDMIEWHMGAVLYLLWGSDGTQLGTAGSDEKFCIWNFLGTSDEREKKMKLYKNRYAKKGRANSTNFGQTIR